MNSPQFVTFYTDFKFKSECIYLFFKKGLLTKQTIFAAIAEKSLLTADDFYRDFSVCMAIFNLYLKVVYVTIPDVVLLLNRT
jgi:hypothetical protein